MRFSFKKTLATVLSIALILSSFVAAFSSSAAEASVVGALSLEDVSATLDDNNQFSAVANISLEQPSSYLHVAFTLADLPQGVSLVAVSADTLAATIVNIDNGIDAIYLEGDKAAVSNVAITFTFTADDDVDFTLAVNKIFAMDGSELDVNINVSDSAFVSVKKQQSGEPEEPCKHENRTTYYDTTDKKWYSECECGDKVETAAVEDTVMGISRSIILDNKIGIKFAVQVSARNNALKKYDDYYIHIETQTYNDSYNLESVATDIASDDTFDVNASLVSYSYMNLSSYEMTIPVKSTIYYLKDGKVVAFSKSYTDTLNARAMAFAKKFDYSDLNSASAKEGAMYLNLIKYGIEAQKYFAKDNKTADIYTAELPTFEAGYENYVTTTLPTLIETKTNTKLDGITAAMSRNVIVGASNAVLYKIQVKDTTVPSTADLSKLRLEVSYTSSADGEVISDTVALDTLDLVSGTYRYNFEKVAIYDLHRKVTAKLYSIDDPTKILITNTFSVETDAIKNINNGTDTDFWKAMAISGHSALDFFKYSTSIE